VFQQDTDTFGPVFAYWLITLTLTQKWLMEACTSTLVCYEHCENN